MRLHTWIPSLVGMGAIAATAFVGSDRGDEPAAMVTLYWSTDCPVAAKYTPRIDHMVELYREKGVAFEFVFPNDGESRETIESYLKERKLEDVPWRIDQGAADAKAHDVKIIPTALVESADGERIYHGAIDDDKNSDRVHHEYLQDAIAATLDGALPTVRTAEPFGCVLMPGDPMPTMETVNYAEHVAEILNERCVDCHRPNQAAPFSLEGYENARKWAPMITWVTQQKIMPPWPARADYGQEFHGVNRLTDNEIEVLKMWAEADAPMGDEDSIPPTPEFPEGWRLGEPDQTLKMQAPHVLGAEGNDEYWYYVFDPGLSESKWVQAFETRPGNREIVHHVIAFIDRTGQSKKMLEREGNGQGGYHRFGGPGFMPGGSLGGWAPGLQPAQLPEDAGFKLNPGDLVVLQIHYHKNGLESKDQTEIGLYFSDGPVENEVDIAWIANPFINIKPGEADQTFRQSYPVLADVKLYSVMPHMHLLGTDMKAWAELPDGTTKELVHVPQWDFNWQFAYALKEPLFLPRGSVIKVEATYDNSTGNPNNPNDPPKRVRWGEATTDEMMLLVAAFAPVKK